MTLAKIVQVTTKRPVEIAIIKTNPLSRKEQNLIFCYISLQILTSAEFHTMFVETELV